ncbi:MAG: hypothetical protein H7Y04_10115, partial [Verrucomicrobia bacterium]|nr:hypothetical protein [Cytophagales bacterium]
MQPTSKRSFYISLGIGLSFSITGLIMLLTGWTAMGIGLFCLLPIGIGISSGILPDRRWAIYGTVAALGIFLILLMVGKVEGFICILMAIPIVAVFVFVGYLVAALIKQITKGTPERLNSSLFYPFLLFVGGSLFETFMGNSAIADKVSTSIVVAANPDKVYDKIINVDTVDVETNFIQNLGLPTPRKCTLTEEKIGGKRICVFEDGEIIETIKDFKRGELLKMDVS